MNDQSILSVLGQGALIFGGLAGMALTGHLMVRDATAADFPAAKILTISLEDYRSMGAFPKFRIYNTVGVHASAKTPEECFSVFQGSIPSGTEVVVAYKPGRQCSGTALIP